MPSSQERLAGAQFDVLDKAVAARAADLMKRQTIPRQTYDEWVTDLTQLSTFANQYSEVAYVAKQWTSEIPRYQQIDNVLSQRITIANPANYNPVISVSGGGCCDGCSGSRIPTLPYSPVGNYGGPSLGGTPLRGSSSIFLGGDTVFNPSVGDLIRSNANPIPFQQLPDAPLIDKSSFATQVLVAVVIGLGLWVLHTVTKK